MLNRILLGVVRARVSSWRCCLISAVFDSPASMPQKGRLMRKDREAVVLSAGAFCRVRSWCAADGNLISAQQPLNWPSALFAWPCAGTWFAAFNGLFRIFQPYAKLLQLPTITGSGTRGQKVDFQWGGSFCVRNPLIGFCIESAQKGLEPVKASTF